MCIRDRDIHDISVVTSGAGAAGIAIIKLLMAMGLEDVVMCDRHGAIYKGRDGLNEEKKEMAEISNKKMKKGSMEEVIKGADVSVSYTHLDVYKRQGYTPGRSFSTAEMDRRNKLGV